MIFLMEAKPLPRLFACVIFYQEKPVLPWDNGCQSAGAEESVMINKRPASLSQSLLDELGEKKSVFAESAH